MTFETKPCRSCQQPVVWAQHETSGKFMPIDPEPHPEGNLWLLTRVGSKASRLIAAVITPERGAGERRYRAHFVTCPKADEFRRRFS